jgi:hypothetical protein
MKSASCVQGGKLIHYTAQRVSVTQSHYVKIDVKHWNLLQPTVRIGLLVEVQLQSALTFGTRRSKVVSIKLWLLYP